MKFFLLFLLVFPYCNFSSSAQQQSTSHISIREFNVLPENSAVVNTRNLQNAINWASGFGAALYVDPSDEPYLKN
ncbi:hypothetical protein [uncultured Cyclobacterium sp.]|uniref:hypothetical protein n=1 Tax=uncultured Cyclobacterium sp. TaxID=453820 RepID=UPI0030EDA5DC|tara:strand:- start:82592 stop:82816 length:225 start_codon:yes stop_codon:yes gene_type:complete